MLSVATHGEKQQEEERGNRREAEERDCARVKRENWARTNWDGNAENRTKRKGEWGVGGGSRHGLFSQSHQTQQGGVGFPLLREELKSAPGGHAPEWQFPVPKAA